MSQDIYRVVLTAGNVRNSHFYLSTCQGIIPTGGIGGKNKNELGRNFTVRFRPGGTFETDVAGDKMILRTRKGMRLFFESSAATEGDIVILERVADREIEVRLEKSN